MRREWLAAVASYGTVVAITGTEGTFQFLIPPYLEQAGYSVAFGGTMYALPFAVALLMRIPAGLVYRGARVKPLVIGGALVVAVMAALHALVTDPLAFVAVRIVYGAALSLVTTVNLAHFLGTHAVGATRGRALGFYTASLSTGFTVGNVVGGAVASTWGYGAAFGAAAALAVLASLLATGLPPLSPAAPVPEPLPAGGRLAAMRRVLADPGLLHAALLMFLVNFLYHLPGGFFPLYALAVGLTIAQIGFIRATFSITNAVTRGSCGLLFERADRGFLIAAAMIVQVIALALIPFFQAFAPLLVLILLTAFGRSSLLVGSALSLAEDPDPRRVTRGVASGVYHASGDLGSLSVSVGGGLLAAALGVEALFRILPLFAAALYFTLGLAAQRAARRASAARAALVG